MSALTAGVTAMPGASLRTVDNDDSGRETDVPTEYIVVTVGTDDREVEFHEIYSSNGVRFPDPQAAIEHGLRAVGSGVFLVGMLHGQRLLELSWMDEVFADREDLLDMAIGIDLEAMVRERAARAAAQLGFHP